MMQGDTDVCVLRVIAVFSLDLQSSGAATIEKFTQKCDFDRLGKSLKEHLDYSKM